MFVELAAKGCEHDHEGRDWGWKLGHLVVAARVLDACHCWLGYRKIDGERGSSINGRPEFYRNPCVLQPSRG